MDFGFFRSLQTLQQKKKATNVDGLVKNVKYAFEELNHITLNKVFLSLQDNYIEMMKVKGGNNFLQPHMDIDRLIREGLLPNCMEVDEVLTRETIELLRLHESGVRSMYDVVTIMNNLGY